MKAARRTVREAIFGNSIVTANELMALKQSEWIAIRNAATDARLGSIPERQGPICLSCGSPVFVSVAENAGNKLPFFSHYSDGDHSCPWFSRRAITPNQARAAQYQGRQEGAEHRRLCELMSRLACLDDECVEAPIAEYMRSSGEAHGRYPDVLLKFRDGRRVALELQRSSSFQTEISGREAFYRFEGIPLLWVLCGEKPEWGRLPQSHRDVIVRHRGNAFMINHAACKESERRRTLVLACFLQRRDGGFDDAQLVEARGLNFSEYGSYIEDRLTDQIVGEAVDARLAWAAAISAASSTGFLNAGHEAIDQIVASVGRQHRQLEASIQDDPWVRQVVVAGVATLLTMLGAAGGEFRNILNRQPNIRAFLNPRFAAAESGPVLRVYKRFLENSALKAELGGSIGENLERALAQATEASTEIAELDLFLDGLFPEALSSTKRAILASAGALPRWATSTEPVASSIVRKGRHRPK
jgi:hypothetical protein